MSAVAPLRVEVCYATPARAWRVPLRLPAGATVADALAAAALDVLVGEAVVDPARLAIFGRAVAPAERLADGDRVEVLRPLVADPKQARRERAARGARGQ